MPASSRAKKRQARIAEESRQAKRNERNERSFRTGGRLSAPALLSVTFVALIACFGAALYSLRPRSAGEQLSLDVVTRYAVCGRPPAATPDAARADREAIALQNYCRGVNTKVATAHLLDEDARILGSIAPRDAGPGQGTQEFWASYPRSDAATNELLQDLFGSGSTVTVDSQSDKRMVRVMAQFVLPAAMIGNLFALLFALVHKGRSGAGELLAVGRVGDKRQRAKTLTATSFGDVAAADDAIIELAEVRDYLGDPSMFAQMGALPSKGILLVGPSGCGKTLLARAVAGEARASFFSMSGSEFVEALVGVGAARVRDLFNQARAAAPAIVFIDELDAVGRQRGAGIGHGHDEREQTLNELLVQMDGFSSSEGVVVLAATNRPDLLDPALLRPGRFDRHVTVERPDGEGRLEILMLHARGRRLADAERDLPHIATNTPGFTGADLANLLNESALLAVRERSNAIERRHLEEAVNRVQSGPKRQGQIISPEEKERFAYHEAGHAVVAAAVGRAHVLQKVSIIARGRGVGHLAQLTEDKAVLTRDDMTAQITIAMAGFAAEEMVLGQPSTGSEQDVERATTIARDMAGRYGMSTRLGPVRMLLHGREVFLGRDSLHTEEVSQPSLEHLDAEVRRIVEEEKDAAWVILKANQHILHELARALADDETVQGEALQRALEAVQGYFHLPPAATSPASPRPSS